MAPTYEDDVTFTSGHSETNAPDNVRVGSVTFASGASITVDGPSTRVGSVSFGMGGTFVTKDKEDKLLEIVLTSTFIPLGVNLTIPWDGSPIGA